MFKHVGLFFFFFLKLLVIWYVKVSLDVQYISKRNKPLTIETKYTVPIQSLYITYRMSFIVDCENDICLPLEACLTSMYENVIMCRQICISRTQ